MTTSLDRLTALVADLERQSGPPKDDAPAAATAGAPGTQTKRTDASQDSPAPSAQTHGIDQIPATLRQAKRWAPWRAQWNAKRGKLDKIPCQLDGRGISTAKPERWYSFEAALKACQGRPEHFAGVGYCMTGPHGIVGIDLDGCVAEDGSIADWAQEVVAQAGSYAELSPSRRGLRVFLAGEVARDWTNHDQGIEVYAGHEPRFLTVTGEALRDSGELRTAPAGWLDGLERRYAKAPTAKAADADMPDLLAEDELPDLAELGLNYKTLNLLAEGVVEGADRSDALFAAAKDLAFAGLDARQVLSVLAYNEHTMGIAESKWGEGRGLVYLWKHHAQKACARAASRVATVDDFPDVSTPAAPKEPGTKPAVMFKIVQAAQHAKGRRVSWLLKGLLPHAEVGAIFGPSKSGKSFLVLDMAAAIARGLDSWRAYRCNQAGVLYVAAEGAAGVAHRLQAHAEFHGYQLADVPLYVLGAAPNLMERAQVNGLMESIRAQCPAGTRLIIIDTLAQTTPGANENSGEAMGAALANCKTIAQATGAMVLLVAHSGKDESRGLRGWSGIQAALDVEIQVERLDNYRSFRVSKLKDGEETDPMAFELQTVTLGADEDGDPITSCVVQHGDATGQKQQRPPRGQIQRAVYRTAQDLTELAGPCTSAQLIESAAAALAPPEAGKRDKRIYAVQKAISDLIESGHLKVDGAMLEAA